MSEGDNRERVEEYVFKYMMADSEFNLIKVTDEDGDIFYQVTEVMNDGTLIFQESIDNGPRILTILNRIKAQS